MRSPIRGIPFGDDPVVGEVIEARLSPGEDFTLAVVVDRSKRADGRTRYKVVWLEDNPDTPTPIKAKTAGVVLTAGHPLLIRRVSEKRAAAVKATGPVTDE